MIRAATLLWAAMAATAGTGLFLLKYQVQAEEHHLRELRKDIVGAEQAIHVLKAEWSYLNDPLRLREQAERHLGMHPMRASQIIAIDAIPLVGGPLFEPPGMAARGDGQTAPRPAGKTDKAKKPAVAPVPHKAQGHTVTAGLGHSTEIASSRIRP